MKHRRLAGCLIGLAVVLLVGGAARDRVDQWIAQTELPPLMTTLSTEIRDRDGRLLRVYTVEDGRWRMAVLPEAVDPLYRRLLLGHEDKRFDRHGGVDLRAFLRAAGQAVWHGEVVSGGSTLSMQVARLLENSGTGRLKGKLRQIRVALALEQRLDKRQIYQLYLERAPFGGNLEGIRAATLAYFGKEPRRLTPAEAALLVALPQSPETRRPDRATKQAEAARDRVLQRAEAAGVLSQEAVRAAQSEPVPTARRPFPMLAPHLADRAVAETPAAQRIDLTVDRDVQRDLETLSLSAVRDLPGGLSAAIVVADHRTGEILASVGAAHYGAVARQGYVDMTRAFRSPGSTLKPVVYALAFDRGLAHPQTLIEDRPVSFGRYTPQNFDGGFHGPLPVAEALRLSLNIPVVMLLQEIGPAHLMEALRKAGVPTRLSGDEAGLAVALGGVGVTLEALTQLYAMLANSGRSQPLHWRRSATARAQTRVISRSAAWQVGDILAGLTPPPGAPKGRIAYKTGTSYGHRDARAVGFDGAHVAAVWVGRPDGTPVPGAFGGDLAAPVLFDIFQRLKARVDPLPPPPPETLILSTALLPQPLRRFTGRMAVFEPDSDTPKLIFPPDGATVPLNRAALPVKLRDGTAPFTVLANGVPVRTGLRRRETEIPDLGEGYSTLSVIDAKGRSAKVTIRVD